jgi:hypothetical protein
MNRTTRKFTAEARRTQSKEVLIIKFSELCDLCASVVQTVFTHLVAAQPRWVPM